MARTTNDLVYEKLCKDLGRVDAERRAILKRLKQTPKFVSNYLNDTLTSFIKTQSWFSRTNAKGEISYFKLVDFKLSAPEITKNGSTLISVNLEWDWYDYNSVSKQKCFEKNIQISVFNDIDKQVLNGRKEASSFDEKKLLKAQMTEKKEKLKAELKALELELKTI